MIGERTERGREVRLRPRGAGRYFGAAFLSCWLCAWAVGETVVLWVLIRGAHSLVSGLPPAPGREPLEAAPALATGLFLLFWLALWTVGGIAAIGQLLQAMWAEDRLIADGAGLTRTRSRGPFRSTRRFARESIRQLVLVPRGDRLALRTTDATHELSALGTRDDRVQAADALRSELGLPASFAEDGSTLPAGWDEVITVEGDRVLARSVATRRVQARVAFGVTAALAVVAVLLMRQALHDPGLLPGALVVTAAAAGLAWGATWLARGRMEWRIGSGRLVLRRRFGAEVRDVFEAARLVLSTSRDSDGDEWFRLEAFTATGAAVPAGARRAAGQRREILSAMNDAMVPRQVGAWLSRAAGVPFDDRSSREAQELDLAELRRQLESSGPVGRVAARFIARLSGTEPRKSA